ncbi:MAG: xylulokinase [Chloroflexi bacterium]|nr:xylulokinase [Chloroflexota bacterium]
MGYLMGIDVGTTGTRAVVVDESGRVAGSATAEYPLHTPRPLWAEQDPADWWRATTLAIRGAVAAAGISGRAVRGIGLSGQMHGLVLLDAGGEVLRPAILWCDQRTQEQCDWIAERVGRQRLIELTCNPALTGFTAPKILWVRQHEPSVYERARKALLPKDFIRCRLTGELASEVSDASGTLLFDVVRRKWSAEMLALLELDRDLLPEVYESPVVSAAVSEAAAGETGLAAGTPVVGGGGDQAAGGVGNGIVGPGLVSSTVGSSGVVFAFTEQPWLDPAGRVHTFCHAVPGKWHVMGVTLGAGLSLRWFRDELAQAERVVADLTGADPYDYLTQEAASAPAGVEGLMYLPYLMGERTPHLDPNARGVFFGLTARHTRGSAVRAVLEGVAYSLRDGLEVLKAMGVPLGEVRFSGGGGRSALWRQIQSDVFGLPGVTLSVSEGPAYGAALLAGVGTGVYGSVEEACAATLQVVDRVAPIPANVRTYETYYPIYRSLYHALKPQFDAVTQAAVSVLY